MFLYTILKQLDLRNIDWNAVADKLDISNGHAARMRYSRMKPQFEGVAAQTRTHKPKKEKSSSKPASKDKARGKRLLLEEEEERLHRQQIFEAESEIQEPAPKRIKRDPTLAFDSPTYQPPPNPYGQFVNPPWSGPMLNFEVPTPGIGLPGIGGYGYKPFVKKEPESFATIGSSFSPIIKTEPGAAITQNGSNATTAAKIKIEPGTAHYSCKIGSPYLGTGNIGLQGSNQIDAGMQQPLYRLTQNPWVQTLDPSCVMRESRPMTMEMPVLRHNRPITDYFTPPEPLPSLGANFMFSPLATSFEDLLTMPLQELPSGFDGDVPIRGLATANVDAGLPHSDSHFTDDITACADKESVSAPEPDGVDTYVDHSANIDAAISASVKKEPPEAESELDRATEAERGDTAIISNDDSRESDDDSGNIPIKQEIIQIDD